jgi:hypothetical protein
MKQFDIYTYDLQKGLAIVTEILARNAVNIKAISTEDSHEHVLIRVVTDDEKTTKKSLDKERVNYKEKEILGIELTDRPGELAKLTKKLSQANVKIESIYILGKDKGKTEIALGVSELERARTALK